MINLLGNSNKIQNKLQKVKLDTMLPTYWGYTKMGIYRGKGAVASAESPGAGVEGGVLCVSEKAEGVTRKLGHLPDAPQFTAQGCFHE